MRPPPCLILCRVSPQGGPFEPFMSPFYGHSPMSPLRPPDSRFSYQPPSDREQAFRCEALHKPGFDVGNELVSSAVDLVLGVEERPPFAIALGFQRLDLLLAGQFFFQRSASVAARLASLICRSRSLISRSRPTFRSSAQPSNFSASASKKRALRSEIVALNAALRSLRHVPAACRVAGLQTATGATDDAWREKSRRATSSSRTWPSSVIAGENQIVLGLVQGLHREEDSARATRLSDQRLQDADLGRRGRCSRRRFRRAAANGTWLGRRTCVGEGMSKPVEVRFPRAARKLVEAEGNVAAISGKGRT